MGPALTASKKHLCYALQWNVGEGDRAKLCFIRSLIRSRRGNLGTKPEIVWSWKEGEVWQHVNNDIPEFRKISSRVSWRQRRLMPPPHLVISNDGWLGVLIVLIQHRCQKNLMIDKHEPWGFDRPRPSHPLVPPSVRPCINYLVDRRSIQYMSIALWKQSVTELKVSVLSTILKKQPQNFVLSSPTTCWVFFNFTWEFVEFGRG